MSHDAESAGSLVAENAALRAEIAHRAQIDAEDMHRLQEQYDHLYRQFEALQKWIARGMALQPQPPIILQGDAAAAVAAVRPQADALIAELNAARAVVAVVRAQWLDEPALNAAIDAYDAAMKGATNE